MSKPRLYIKIFVYFLLFVCLLLGIIYCVPPFLRFFMPFVIGWIIAMIANPLVRFMEHRIKILRKHSSVIIIVVALGGVVGLLYLLMGALARQLGQLLSDLPALYQQLEGAINSISHKLDGFYQVLPDQIQSFVMNLSDSIGIYLSNMISNLDTPTISDAGSLAKNAAEFLFMSIITVLSAYFFIAERDNLVVKIKKITPQVIINQYQLVIDNFKTAVGGYFKAQFKIMLIITLILFIGFLILKVDYSFLLALGIAFLDLLPVFGTGAVIWPWALVDLISGNYLRVIGLLVIYLVCQIVKQLLQPKMVGDSIGISPFQTLLFMFIGYRLGGLLGLIIGIPIGMVLVNFYRSGMFDQLIKGLKIVIHDIGEFVKF